MTLKPILKLQASNNFSRELPSIQLRGQMLEVKKPTYRLWNPVIASDNLSCSFDVTQGDFSCDLEYGTKELISTFLQFMKIEAEPKDWLIETFCSAYYSSSCRFTYPDERYRSRCKKAWRVIISFVKPCQRNSQSKTPDFKPICVYEIKKDDNWDYLLRKDSWRWTTIRYIAIIDFSRWKWKDFVADKGFELDPIAKSSKFLESYELHFGKIVQARFDLGEIYFPHGERKIVEFLRAFIKYRVALNWEESDYNWNE
jgi:hypothetical protein